MKTKIIPFDIETAKKIQSGEIEGKIKYCENDGYAYDADIIRYDLIADKSKAKPNSTLYRTIVAVIDFDDYQGVRTFNTDGYGCNNNGDDTKLFIEVPYTEHEFKPFDKVLVRNPYKSELCVPMDTWIPGIFQYKNAYSNLYFVSGKAYFNCIPYEGNEHLVGTTDKPH